MKLRLVDNWKSAWKWLSAQALAITGALNLAWAALPDKMQDAIPPTTLAWMSGAVLAIGFIGRLVTFAPKPEEEDGGADAA